MLNIDKIISDYLKNNSTDYAILINGDWGCVSIQPLFWWYEI